MKRYTFLTIVLLLVLAYGGTKVVMKYIENKRLDELLPEVKEAFQKGYAECEAEGIKLQIGRTFASQDEQNAVNPANTGTSNSWHTLRRAVDVLCFGPDGTLDSAGKFWDTTYRRMHEIFAKYGFTNIAFNSDGTKRYITTKAGTKTWDGGHLQFTSGMTYAQARDDLNSRALVTG